jgi:hypothetical protein
VQALALSEASWHCRAVDACFSQLLRAVRRLAQQRTLQQIWKSPSCREQAM